uniref:Uncharacterized protein n=1 Tax=Arundo donax TaxID=35708 RepID=A0A0A9ER27_ARUDO
MTCHLTTFSTPLHFLL